MNSSKLKVVVIWETPFRSVSRRSALKSYHQSYMKCRGGPSDLQSKITNFEIFFCAIRVVDDGIQQVLGGCIKRYHLNISYLASYLWGWQDVFRAFTPWTRMELTGKEMRICSEHTERMLKWKVLSHTSVFDRSVDLTHRMKPQLRRHSIWNPCIKANDKKLSGLSRPRNSTAISKVGKVNGKCVKHDPFYSALPNLGCP